MVNYQEAKIYKIINDEMEGLVYYGSTCNTFAKRLSTHKKNRDCTSRVLFEYGKPQMILVEKYPCNDKMELKQRERYYIENNECVNKCIPNRTQKEYKEDNKEQISLQKKEYYQDNREQFLLQQKEYRENNKEQINKKTECDCGGKYTHNHKARHLKSKKHQAFISSN